jgi:hypothetical protein
MRSIRYLGQFKKDYKRMEKRGGAEDMLLKESYTRVYEHGIWGLLLRGISSLRFPRLR